MRSALVGASPRQQALQIAAQNQTGMICGNLDVAESLYLRLENLRVPAAGEEGRVSAEQQPPRASHFQRLAEDTFEIEAFGLVAYPTVAAGSVQIDVGAKIAEHESLAQVARAEMRDHEIHARELHGDGMQIDGIGIAHVEQRREAQLPPHAHREDTAMHEDDGAGMRGGGFKDRAHARVRHRVTMHGWKQTNALHPAAGQGPLHALDATGRVLRGCGIGHEEAPEAIRMEAHGRGHRVFVSWNAGDERGLCHARFVQLLYPGCREIFARSGDAPVQDPAYLLHILWGLALRRQRREKRGREKVDVRVAHLDITPWSLHRVCSSA